MEITFYKNTADPRVVNKLQSMVSLDIVDAEPYFPIKILTPAFRLTKFNRYLEANYCYIPELHRYYFVHPPELDSGNVLNVTCEVDPLTSFKNDILNLDCICLRNERDFNPYLSDDIPSSVKAITTNFIINDSTPFIIPQSTDVNCYVLTLNGLVGEVAPNE